MVNKLVYPPEWNEVWTKYPHGLTIFEAVVDWVNKVNDLVDLTNTTQANLLTFYESIVAEIAKLYTNVLPASVETVLDEWYVSGKLTDLINLGFLGEIERQLADYDQQIVNKINKGELVINVKDFGAIGNGIADDTLAINNAINSLPTGLYGGGTVYIPAGNYRITTPILLKAGIILKGYSAQATRIFADANDFALIKLDIAPRVTITDLMLDGIGKTGSYGIAIYSSSGVNLKNLWIESFDVGVYVLNSYFLDFNTIKIMGSKEGYVLNTGSNVINMTNCYSVTTYRAMKWENSSTLMVSGCSFEGKNEVLITNVQGATFTGNYWEGMHEDADIPNFLSIGDGNGNSAKGISITGNFFLIKAQYGISLRACEGVDISGNFFSTSIAAILMYQYSNSPKRGINIGANSYNIATLPHDITKAIAYEGGDFDGLNCNLNETRLQPLMFTKQKVPQNTSLELESSVLYWDGTSLKVKIKDSGGVVIIKTVTLT